MQSEGMTDIEMEAEKEVRNARFIVHLNKVSFFDLSRHHNNLLISSCCSAHNLEANLINVCSNLLTPKLERSLTSKNVSLFVSVNKPQ